MDRNDEIELATAIKGTNGFVCMVEIAWTNVSGFPELWNPKIRGADCLNPTAALYFAVCS